MGYKQSEFSERKNFTLNIPKQIKKDRLGGLFLLPKIGKIK